MGAEIRTHPKWMKNQMERIIWHINGPKLL